VLAVSRAGLSHDGQVELCRGIAVVIDTFRARFRWSFRRENTENGVHAVKLDVHLAQQSLSGQIVKRNACGKIELPEAIFCPAHIVAKLCGPEARKA
jgi:hypothetical protein